MTFSTGFVKFNFNSTAFIIKRHFDIKKNTEAVCLQQLKKKVQSLSKQTTQISVSFVSRNMILLFGFLHNRRECTAAGM